MFVGGVGITSNKKWAKEGVVIGLYRAKYNAKNAKISYQHGGVDYGI